MSTIVYQSFQSCYDDITHVSEPWSLSLKLTPPKPQTLTPKFIEPSQKPHAYNNYTYNSNDTRGGGWSCIESLSTNNFQTRKEDYTALPVYIHPLIKRASSKLSDKSLEMCTENLGSETGTDMITPTGNGFSSLFSSPPPAPKKKTEYNDGLTSITTTTTAVPPPSSCCQRSRLIRSVSDEAVSARKKSRSSSCREFPPPLTSMSGSSSILVRPRREMGRLVMTAVSNSPRKSNIVTERSNGRLRMSLFVDESEEVVVGGCCDGDDGNSTVDEVMESDDRTVASGGENDGRFIKCDEGEDGDKEGIEIGHGRDGEGEEEEDDSGGVREEEEEKVEEGDEEGEEEEDGRNVHFEGDNIETGGRKMEVMAVRRRIAASATTTTTTGDQFHRPSRCNESGRGGTNGRTSTRRLINWETFWVATSS